MYWNVGFVEVVSLLWGERTGRWLSLGFRAIFQHEHCIEIGGLKPFECIEKVTTAFDKDNCTGSKKPGGATLKKVLIWSMLHKYAIGWCNTRGIKGRGTVLWASLWPLATSQRCPFLLYKFFVVLNFYNSFPLGIWVIYNTWEMPLWEYSRIQSSSMAGLLSLLSWAALGCVGAEASLPCLASWSPNTEVKKASLKSHPSRSEYK